MGRSLFVLNSGKGPALRAQFRKLRDDLAGLGPAADGPFRDSGNAVAELSEHVRVRMQKGCHLHPVGAALTTLAPQNLPLTESSWLEVPFMLSQNPAIHCDSAGAVASAEPVRLKDQQVRAVDLEGITLLGAAVLRRMGTPAFYGYLHFDERSPGFVLSRALSAMSGMPLIQPFTPCLAVPNREMELYSLIPPFVFSLRDHRSITHLEVLDDAALLFVLRTKTVYLDSASLMRDVSAKAHAFTHAEARIRAISIGHAAYGCGALWTEDELERDQAAVAAMLGKSGAEGPRSVRSAYDALMLHRLSCPLHHRVMAAEALLCARAKSELGIGLREVSDMSPGRFYAALSSLRGHPCLEKLNDYMGHAGTMEMHLHDISGCPGWKGFN
ncbi:MAG: hypothetical protein AB1529_04810 [Candidatus Micrarchaeota archaeon]